MEAERLERILPRDQLPRKPSVWHTLMVALVLLACSALMLVQASRGRAALPLTGGVVGDFSLIDQDGRQVSSRSLSGKIWVASFIFTNCRDTCPCISTNMLVLQDALRADSRLASKVQLVSFSVDPERDKPESLKAYAQRYGADTALWSFLTGPPGAVTRIAESAFRLPVGQAPLKDGSGSAPDVIHSDRLSLVDGQGRVRGYYRPVPAELELLVRDMGRLAEEAPGTP